MSVNSSVFDHIIALFRAKGSQKYMISEPITQEQHALQSYLKMKQLKPLDVHARISALLHDIGHLLSREPIDPKTGVNDYHEFIGGKWLMLQGFDPRVYLPIMLHVDAKRYLCTVKKYELTPGSRLSLKLQGGPMKDPRERQMFEQSPHFQTAIQLRHCDDRGKELRVDPQVTLESLKNEVISCLYAPKPQSRCINTIGYYD